MNIDHMFDLDIKPLQNGGFQLSQQGSGLDEPDVVELHPVQVRLLAERAGLIPAPAPGLVDRLQARHVERLQALRGRLHDLHDIYYDEIVDRCGSGIEISLHLEAIGDLVYDLIEDIGTAPPAEPVTKKNETNETNAAISVTPTKRGRPKKEDALTPAERQAGHRAKQAEPGSAQQLNLS